MTFLYYLILVYTLLHSNQYYQLLILESHQPLLILELGILPKPQGVSYIVVMYEDPDLPFGFAELGEALPTDVDGYAELGDIPLEGGVYSELFEA